MGGKTDNGSVTFIVENCTRGPSRKWSYAECIYWRKENFINWHLKKNYMKEPKLPYKLKWGNRTAARVDEVEVHESVADDVFMKKPRTGTYYKYINLKNIVHEEG